MKLIIDYGKEEFKSTREMLESIKSCLIVGVERVHMGTHSIKSVTIEDDGYNEK